MAIQNFLLYWRLIRLTDWCQFWHLYSCSNLLALIFFPIHQDHLEANPSLKDAKHWTHQKLNPCSLVLQQAVFQTPTRGSESLRGSREGDLYVGNRASPVHSTQTQLWFCRFGKWLPARCAGLYCFFKKIQVWKTTDAIMKIFNTQITMKCLKCKTVYD